MRKIVHLVSLATLVASVLVVVTPLPASAATVARDITQFACAPGVGSDFTDIASSAHKAAIECVVDYGLASGTTTTTFSPAKSVTRGQMATFLANFIDNVSLTGAPLDGPIGPQDFTDVAGNTHEGNIYYLRDLGIAQGTSPTTFSPNLPVTRAQMATFLVRTMDVLGFTPPAAAPDAFTDDEGGPHEPAINAVAALGVAQGTAPGIYQPSSPVARGAMATFLARMLDLGIEEGFALPFILTEALAALTGTAVSPGPGSSGTGTAIITTTDVDGVLCFELDGLDGATEIHVHQGAVGAVGPAVATIPVPTEGGYTIGCTRSSAASAIGAAPDGYYLDVHTAQHAGGALRGQLGSIETSASAALVREQVVPGPGSPDAFGIASVATTSQPNVLCVQAVAFTFEDTITSFHLHQGALHANGPVVLDFGITASDFVFLVRCVESNTAGTVATNPGDFYLDLHSTSYPDGMLRGQLVDDGV